MCAIGVLLVVPLIMEFASLPFGLHVLTLLGPSEVTIESKICFSVSSIVGARCGIHPMAILFLS